MVERRGRSQENPRSLRAWYKVWGLSNVSGRDGFIQEQYVYAENEGDALSRLKKNLTQWEWKGIPRQNISRLEPLEARALIDVIKANERPFNVTLPKARDGFRGVRMRRGEDGRRVEVRVSDLITKRIAELKQDQMLG